MSLALLAGCHSAPTVHEFNSSRTYDQSLDETWDHLIRYLDDHNIQVLEATKETGVVRAFTRREDAFNAEQRIADCGNAAGSSRYTIAVPLSYTPSEITLNVVLVADGPQTTVTVGADLKYIEHAFCFDGPYRTGSCRAIVQCSSTGAIQKQILNSL